MCCSAAIWTASTRTRQRPFCADPISCAPFEGEVDDAPGDERAPVVHPQDHAAAGLQVGDLHIGAEGEGLVGRGHGVHVVAFAAGSGLAVEVGPVPARHAFLHVAFGRGEGIVPDAVDLIGTLCAQAGRPGRRGLRRRRRLGFRAAREECHEKQHDPQIRSRGGSHGHSLMPGAGRYPRLFSSILARSSKRMSMPRIPTISSSSFRMGAETVMHSAPVYLEL